MSEKTKAPVMLAFERHVGYIREKNRKAWLANMAEDIVVQDPVGPTPINPGGSPLDKDGMAQLWDRSMGKIGEGVPPPRFEMRSFYCCGSELACVGRTVSAMPRKGDGKIIECIAEGVFLYGVNEEGKLSYVKAFFDFEKVYSHVDFDLPEE